MAKVAAIGLGHVLWEMPAKDTGQSGCDPGEAKVCPLPFLLSQPSSLTQPSDLSPFLLSSTLLEASSKQRCQMLTSLIPHC